MSAPPPFPGSPRPSSGYCSSDDEPANNSLVLGVPSGRRSGSASAPSSSGYGSCPVTPDSATSEINFSSGGGLFDDCLVGLDSGFPLLSNGCDVSWLRSTPPTLDDLGLDLGSGIPDVFRVAGPRTSFETGNGDDSTGSGRLSVRRFPLPGGVDVPEARCCQRIPISVKVADSSSNFDDSVARGASLPSDRDGHDNATRTQRVVMTTTSPSAKPESNKRTICRCVTDDVTSDVINDVTNDVINDVTNDVTVETPRHVLSDHGYSTTSPSLFPPLPPPAKQPRLSPCVPPPGPLVREASILAALLLTKEPLRANAGSDALVAHDGSRRSGHHRHQGGPGPAGPSPLPSSVLEGLLLTGRGGSTGDVVGVPAVSGWKASFSGLLEEEVDGYVLDSDHLLRDKDGLHVGLASAAEDEDFTWTTSPQMSSLEMDELFTQHFEPDDLWMHLSELL